MMNIFKPYPRYRPSGKSWLGDVPEHWGVRPLKRFANIRNGSDYKKVESQDGLYPVVGSGGEFTRANEYLYDKESVLLGRKGTIDKPLYINVPFWTIDTMFYTEIESYVSAKYLYYSSLTIPFSMYSTDTALPSMTQEALSNHSFSFPNVDEQRSIAAFLDYTTAQLDDLIAQKQRLIELLREKRQALITQAVTKGLNPKAKMKDSGVAWLGQIPEHWRCVPLTKYLESLVDYRGATPEKKDEGVFIITTSNIRDGVIDYECSKEWIDKHDYENVMHRGMPEKGDVLFTMEAPLGEVANVDREDVALAQRIIKMRGCGSDLNNCYLKYWIMGDYFQQCLSSLATGSTAKGIKAGRLYLLKCVLPSIDEQAVIVDYLDRLIGKIDYLKFQTERSINALNEYRQSLISAAVTGKIDLRDWKTA